MGAVRVALPPRHVAWVDANGRPTMAFANALDAMFRRVGGSEQDKVEVAAQSGEVAKAAADTAQSAANVATAKADIATEKADVATAGAQTAIDSADTAFATAALSAAYPSGLTLTGAADGATAKIGISNHTMVYTDKSVSVTGDSITGLAYDTLYNIYYDDPGRLGGAVTFHAATDYSAFPTPANPNRVFIGTAKTPATSGDVPINGNPRAPYGQNTSI